MKYTIATFLRENKEAGGWEGKAGRTQGGVGRITMLLNLNCEIHEIYSLYINKTSYEQES